MARAPPAGYDAAVRLILFLCALALAPAARAQDCLAFLSDVEGSAAKLARFEERSPAFVAGADGRRHLAPGARFVHGGDSFDRFAGDLAVARELTRLEAEAPDRVVLIAGNRDLDKLRLRPELSPGALAHPPVERAAAFAAWRHGRPDNRVNRLHFLLEMTMGSPSGFELRRAELGHATDDDVLESYLSETRAGGGAYRLLSRAHLMARVGDTLFVHGGITDANIGLVPGEAARAPDVDAWIARLDAWYHRELARWDAAADGWSGEGPRVGEPLIAYGEASAGLAVNPDSVVYNRNVDAQGKIALPGPRAIAFLLASGIRRLAIGHTPSGQAPVVLRTPDERFEQVLVDSSRADLPEEPSLVAFTGPHLAGTDVSAAVRETRTGRALPVRFHLTSGAPTPIGKRTADGALVIGTAERGVVTYQLEPGFRVIYQLRR